MIKSLEHWQVDADLAGVRDHAALLSLPALERETWKKLWEDVASVLETVKSAH